LAYEYSDLNYKDVPHLNFIYLFVNSNENIDNKI